MPLAMITFLTGSGGEVDPGYGVSVGSGRPSNELPRPPGSIGTLPVFPFDPVDPGYGQGGRFRPDNSLPSGSGRPDNSLPNGGAGISNPIQLHPGLRLVVKFVACYGFIAVPDNSLPDTAEPK